MMKEKKTFSSHPNVPKKIQLGIIALLAPVCESARAETYARQLQPFITARSITHYNYVRCCLRIYVVVKFARGRASYFLAYYIKIISSLFLMQLLTCIKNDQTA